MLPKRLESFKMTSRGWLVLSRGGSHLEGQETFSQVMLEGGHLKELLAQKWLGYACLHSLGQGILQILVL